VLEGSCLPATQWNQVALYTAKQGEMKDKVLDFHASC